MISEKTIDLISRVELIPLACYYFVRMAHLQRNDQVDHKATLTDITIGRKQCSLLFTTWGGTASTRHKHFQQIVWWVNFLLNPLGREGIYHKWNSRYDSCSWSVSNVLFARFEVSIYEADVLPLLVVVHLFSCHRSLDGTMYETEQPTFVLLAWGL